ncbi:hypothetical protein BOX15_Mlig024303g6 [Macrostomum lignano]|uniref:Uncharacterized protein n=1 Tax=Macrostomum lignano TaxID=282301 RepID=A0A267GCG0_9PLAT|nr:hypothetical protein BOX15_Mlig024303g2 [Macrostomum lignano]PAA82989.1 hypothetical protein BOX15_Mlig024303g6 [Macrostomum lignano]
MGMHRDPNRKRPAHVKHNHKRHREKIKRRRAAKPPRICEIPDADLQTPGQLRKLRTNPNANIELSGKRKRKIIKQLRRELKEQQVAESAMEVSATDSSNAGKKRQKKQQQAASVAMETDQ